MTGPRAHIDLSALVENWRMLARRAAPAEAAAVVKADAYGLGAAPVGRALAKAGCRRFYVAWPHEGAALRQALGGGPEIAVFHGPTPDTLPLFAANSLQPVLNSKEQVKLWAEAAGGSYALHVDTGMNRLGLPPNQWDKARQRLGAGLPTHLVSHLACPDEPDHPMNVNQLRGYRHAITIWPEAKKSLASTAGVYLGADYLFDEVRPGIGLYGGGPTPADGPPPRPVVTLTAPILQIRHVHHGDSTGYGATWKSHDDRTLATLGLGYADGFLRAASNKGYGVIRGEKRPVLGRVSMDLIMLDVTGLDVAPGDEVEFLGASISIAEQAEAMATIDYEILTRLGPRIQRSYAGGE